MVVKCHILITRKNIFMNKISLVDSIYKNMLLERKEMIHFYLFDIQERQKQILRK
jgi:hypothetical protein